MFSTIGLVTLFYLYGYEPQRTINQEEAIKNIMNYPMVDIVKRCQKDYNYTNEDMVILERELKRYLILSTFNKKNGLGSGMYSKDVDNLWHSFILFTHEYANFCKRYANHFLHHIPETNPIKTPEKLEEVHKDFQAFIKNYEKIFHEEIHPIWLLDMCEE